MLLNIIISCSILYSLSVKVGLIKCKAFPQFRSLTHWTAELLQSQWLLLTRGHSNVSFPLSGVRKLICCWIFCRLLFVILPFHFQPLYSLSLFELCILINPLVCSNFSSNKYFSILTYFYLIYFFNRLLTILQKPWKIS